MTYRELIEICNKTPAKVCYDDNCPYQKECNAFRYFVGEYPSLFYNALGIDFDAEISDAETVEFTYCRDCTHYFDSSWCCLYEINVKENDFCSWIKRKDGKNENN